MFARSRMGEDGGADDKNPQQPDAVIASADA
jgi:hypothetical protein